MNSENFRRAALALPEAIEQSHMAHPDFRVGGKIFATIGPDATWGMVKLTPEQQAEFLAKHPEACTPAAGAWGDRGATLITFRSARVAMARHALLLAWRNTAPRKLLRDSD